MIAELCRWSAAAKLVHLTTRLRGQAFAFYRSCPSEQRSDYDQLVAELSKRFTPVRIQAVETSRFHDRKQQTGIASTPSRRRLGSCSTKPTHLLSVEAERPKRWGNLCSLVSL